MSFMVGTDQSRLYGDTFRRISIDFFSVKQSSFLPAVPNPFHSNVWFQASAGVLLPAPRHSVQGKAAWSIVSVPIEQIVTSFSKYHSSVRNRLRQGAFQQCAAVPFCAQNVMVFISSSRIRWKDILFPPLPSPLFKSRAVQFWVKSSRQSSKIFLSTLVPARVYVPFSSSP